MDTILDNQTFIEQVTSLSSLDQIIETIIVDTNEGSISVEKIQKNGDSVKIINEKIDYKLHSTKLIIKSDSEFTKNIIISDIDTCFDRYIGTCLYAYIHKYVYRYIYSYLHACIRTYR